MFVLDTDHMTFLDRPDSTEGVRIRQRMEQARLQGVVSTVVSYEEQTRGWLAYAARAKSLAQVVDAYRRLEGHVTVYRSMPLLGFDEAAAIRFQDLKRANIRVGTLDLRIASIVLANDATLVSRNRRDFERVPGLRIEDWTAENA
jgi:tRNA(fMet)-specific endonuclease VapC